MWSWLQLLRPDSLRARKSIGAALLAVCFTLQLAAQTTGTITGKVEDRTGGLLAGAAVTARQSATGATRATHTGTSGRFIFPALPVGSYEIRIEHTGFRPLVQQGVILTVGVTAVINVTLDLGALDEEVTVVGQLPLVNTQSPELSYLVSEQAIQELPLNGRNYTDLALLQPGVVAFPHRDGGSVVAHGLGTSINGRDPRSNVYLLDGTPQNDFTNSPAGSAAGTALGMETIREFRVEVNAYSAEFGRNSGGQINVLTKSGTNDPHGSLYYFHRNDNFDARNFFDPGRTPEFKRHQLGATIGGPLQRDRSFFFVGYEALRESLGRNVSTIVPDLDARAGVLPDPNNPGGTIVVSIDPAVQPYLNAFPVPNGPAIGGGLAAHSFAFKQEIDQDFGQVRVDHIFSARQQFFARYTFDDAEQRLPTDFPQFPRAFVSRNQFFTAEHRQVLSPTTLQTLRFSFSRTRIGQDVEANVAPGVQPFVPGRPVMGDIDIGGIPRFGPQISVNVSLVQNVFGFEHGLVLARGRHLWKLGGLVERYQDNMFNPTFSLGLFAFADLRGFLENRPLRFVGLRPDGALDRYWRFTLFGVYAEDRIRVHPRLTATLGFRYEFSTMPRDTQGRDSALINLSDPAPTSGQLYRNPTRKNLSPRIGLAWDLFGDGKTSLRSGYGIYFNTNNQQNLIVTITNPPATPRIIIPNPTFPTPPFNLGIGNSIRPVEWNLKNPNVHIWNLSVQRELWVDTVVTVGYAGSRGVHLLRSGDVNVPTPQTLPDGTLFFPATAARPNPAFSTIELKRSDGDSWYHALIFEVRKRWSRGVSFQSSYTFSRNIDTTQASTFFSDATSGTTSAFPEFPGLDYNRGLSDYHAKHNWVVNFTWQLPFARNLPGVAGRLLGGWQVAGIANVRSGNPLTVFVQRNRSRSRWSPSLGPGLGFDRPSLAPGRTHQSAILGGPDRYFDPTAFVLQPAGTLGTLGRGSLIGPNFRTLDLSLVKNTGMQAWDKEATLQLRFEAFNLFNRTNFGTPSLQAFAGAADGEPPLASLGRIRSTVTSSRQIQLGLRVLF